MWLLVSSCCYRYDYSSIVIKQFKAISNAISTYEDFNLLVSHLSEGVCRTFKVKGCSLLILDQIEQHIKGYHQCQVQKRHEHDGEVGIAQNTQHLEKRHSLIHQLRVGIDDQREHETRCKYISKCGLHLLSGVD